MLTDATNLSAPRLGPAAPAHPALRQLVRVAGRRGDAYRGYVQQWHGGRFRDREEVLVWEPNGIPVPDGYLRGRLVGSHGGLPLIAVSLACCAPPLPGPSPSAGSSSASSASSRSPSAGASPAPSASSSVSPTSASPPSSSSAPSFPFPEASASPSSFSPSPSGSPSPSPSSSAGSAASSSLESLASESSLFPEATSGSSSSGSPSSASPSSASPSAASDVVPASGSSSVSSSSSGPESSLSSPSPSPSPSGSPSGASSSSAPECYCVPDACGDCPPRSLPSSWTLFSRGVVTAEPCGQLRGRWKLNYAGGCVWKTDEVLDFTPSGGSKGPAWELRVGGPGGTFRLFAAGTDVGVAGVATFGCGDVVTFYTAGWFYGPGPPGGSPVGCDNTQPIVLDPDCNCAAGLPSQSSSPSPSPSSSGSPSPFLPPAASASSSASPSPSSESSSPSSSSASESSESSSPSSGPLPYDVTPVRCVPNQVAKSILYLSVFSVTDCDCLTGTFALTFDPATLNTDDLRWYSDTLTLCDGPAQYVLHCTGNTWVIELLYPPPGNTIFANTPASTDYDPMLLQFVSLFSGGGPPPQPCVGELSAIVTESP